MAAAARVGLVWLADLGLGTWVQKHYLGLVDDVGLRRVEFTVTGQERRLTTAVQFVIECTKHALHAYAHVSGDALQARRAISVWRNPQVRRCTCHAQLAPVVKYANRQGSSQVALRAGTHVAKFMCTVC